MGGVPLNFSWEYLLTSPDMIVFVFVFFPFFCFSFGVKVIINRTFLQGHLDVATETTRERSLKNTSWKHKHIRIPVTMLSSAEAELFALIEGLKEGISSSFDCGDGPAWFATDGSDIPVWVPDRYFLCQASFRLRRSREHSKNNWIVTSSTTPWTSGGIPTGPTSRPAELRWPLCREPIMGVLVRDSASHIEVPPLPNDRPVPQNDPLKIDGWKVNEDDMSY